VSAAWSELREVEAVYDLHHDDLRGGTGFDPRPRSYMKYVCRYNDWDAEVGVVWRAIAVVRWVANAFFHYHPWDELDNVQNQSRLNYRTATVGIAAPCVNASVLEMPFPSLAWVTRRMTAKNSPALKLSWALNVG